MDPLEFNEFCDTRDIFEDLCRICLQNGVILNWNTEIPEDFGLTYKECYYKYTQLDSIVIDPYSQMLCQTCARALQESHYLITKALESHAILQRTHLTEIQIDCIEDEYIKYKENNVGNKEKEKTFESTMSLSPTLEQLSCESIIDAEMTINGDTDDEDFESTSPNINTFKNGKSNKKLPVKKIASQKRNTNKKTGKVLASKEETGKKYMCSNCSKIFVNMAMLRRHEETHNNTRERPEVCNECGLRFFNKSMLNLHLTTHNTLREKKYKCEFCDKAYFNMGSLNVHRRIHLGQMIPCPLCSKEFYRQDDLNRHSVTAHSSTTIHTNIKKRSKYYVYCKDCNKQLRTTTWKAHQAAHLNEPLTTCLICNKGFYSRSSITEHMHKKHNYKTREEYEQFIAYSNPKRLSHLLLEQQDILKPNTA